jgi:spermidine dehydrogenase
MVKTSSFSDIPLTRRDYLGGSLIGAGAALLAGCSPIVRSREDQKGTFSDDWTGYGGAGDYASSNGNTAAVRDAAHLIRDRGMAEVHGTAQATGEVYDMVVVGGGFAGISAIYHLVDHHGDAKNCLMLENHPVFGGEAKQNAFDVDGYRIYGPQGSNGFSYPVEGTVPGDMFRAIGIPSDYAFAKTAPDRSSLRVPQDSYYSMYWGERHYDVGYFFKDRGDASCVKNPWSDNLVRMPLPERVKADLIRAYANRAEHFPPNDPAQWLDSMSYKDLLEKELGLSEEVTKFVSPIAAIANFGAHADVISAYAASLIAMPGTTSLDTHAAAPSLSFPGGNTGLYRHIIKHLLPAAIKGDANFEDVVGGDIDFAQLDQAEQSFRIRLNATVLDVRHEGPPESSEFVDITYVKDGTLHQVKARSVVMATGGWVARRMIADMPDRMAKAYAEFHHSPVLVANVALTNWRFLDRLGIASARWFEGFGAFCSIRRPMIVGDQTQPFDPDKPIVLTFYTPFDNPGLTLAEQGAIGRAQLLSKSYAEYENEILQQMTLLFAQSGFDARRDVAGIVLNRWGHAYNSPQPGFYFGKAGDMGPQAIVKQGYGRIRFGHSELGPRMNYRNALVEGARAAREAMTFL